MHHRKLLAASTIHQAPVVQMLDSAIHWINQLLVLLVFIRWIVIYLVDTAIHRLNNWGKEEERVDEFMLQDFISPCECSETDWKQVEGHINP